jgi:hypothetical protein
LVLPKWGESWRVDIQIARVFYLIAMLCQGVVQSAHSITESSTSPNLPEVQPRLQEAEARQAIAEAGTQQPLAAAARCCWPG